MGFFSWKCNKCGFSLRSEWSTDDATEWMKHGVVATEDGQLFKGEYDGYGRLGKAEANLAVIEERVAFSLYHEKCWEKAGRPLFIGHAPYAEDQGFFLNDNEDSLPFGGIASANLSLRQENNKEEA